MFFFVVFFRQNCAWSSSNIWGSGNRNKEEKEGRKEAVLFDTPYPFLLLFFFPDTSNIRPSQTFCAHVAGSHIQFFFPFWLVAKIHDQHSGPPFPFKIRRRISWERKKEGKGKYVAFSLNSNKIQLFPLLFLEKKLFLKIFILTNSAREEFKNKT